MPNMCHYYPKLLKGTKWLPSLLAKWDLKQIISPQIKLYITGYAML